MIDDRVVKLDSLFKDKPREEIEELILGFIRDRGGIVETTRMMREGDITARMAWKLTAGGKLELEHNGDENKWMYRLKQKET